MKKKQIAIALLIIGVVGFIYSQNQKKKHLIFEKRISNTDEFVHKQYVQSGNTYLFSFWGNNEHPGLHKWATLEYNFRLARSGGDVIEEKKVTATGSDGEGNQRAANGDDVHYKATQSEELILTLKLIEGDYTSVEIYENLTDNTYWMPVLFIALFIAGLFMFLKARASANVQGNPIPSKRKTIPKKRK